MLQTVTPGTARAEGAATGPLPDGHPAVRQGAVGVLLVNLGTPTAADAPAVRRYLREFLSDRRVVDYPRAVWLPVLHGIILNVRPKKTAAAYAEVWDRETNESPLRRITREQTEGVAARLSKMGAGAEPGADIRVAFAMRYGEPGIAAEMAKLQAEGCTRILIAPLYPQYSATTTGTVVDAAGRYLQGVPWQPAIRSLPAFHDEPDYIRALAESAKAHVPEDAERVLLSFHGLPQRYLAAGDPYHCHCQKTARLLREAMGWTEDYAPLGFQSKFGPEKWLEPATEDLVKGAAADGIKRLAVMAPAFVADCIETLEEVGLGLAETFREAGGETLTAIPCLNTDEAWLDALAGLLRRELMGWVA